MVVPLACWDAEASQLLVRSECLNLLPAEPVLHVGGGLDVGTSGVTSVQCTTRSVAGMSLERSVDVWPVVTWSEGEFPWCAFSEADLATSIPAALVQKIQRQAVGFDLRLAPPRPSELSVVPVFDVHMDKSPEAYRFYKAVWPLTEPEPGAEAGSEPAAAQEELFMVAPEQDPLRVVLPGKGNVNVVGAVDFNGDGRCELVYGEEWANGTGAGIARWTGSRFEVVASHSCGR